MSKLPASLNVPMNDIKPAPARKDSDKEVKAKEGRAVRAREAAGPQAAAPSTKDRPPIPRRERHDVMKTGYHRIK